MMVFRPVTRLLPGLLLLLTMNARLPADDVSPLDVLRRSSQSLRRFVMDNGMIGLIQEDHSAPVVSVQIWLGTGAIHEESNLGAGLSHYMEHMIFKGTARRGPTDITRDIDNAGGEINAYTAQDRTVFHADLPSSHWKVGVDVLADAVMNAALPQEEWEREKEVILREFAMGYDDPERVINKLLWATAYRVHPYRIPVIGYEEVFRSMTREDLVAFKERHYVPDNMIVVVGGDVAADEVEAYLRAGFAEFKRRPRAPVVLPVEPAQVAPREARQTGNFNVGRLQWAYHTVPLSHPDAPALDVLATIAGQGRSSRLVKKIKEELKLVHDIDAWSYTPKEPGLFGISATYDPSNEAAVVQAIQDEVSTWTNAPCTEEELDKAKRMLLVSELGSLQTISGQVGSYASGEFYTGNPHFNEFYLEAVQRVGSRQIREVAGRYLADANRTLVILTPAVSNAAAAAAAARPADGVARLTLSNGVPLLVREDHRLPFVYFCATLSGGLLSEEEQNNGITQLLGDLLTRGTATRSAEDIALETESLGASLYPFSGRNSFGLQGQCLSQDAGAVFGLFADCLLHAQFPEAEVEKQRSVQLASIQQQREQPMFLAQESLRALLFPNHPYRLNVSGSEASVAGLTRAQLQAHYARHLNRSNVVLAIFGDITPEAARALAEQHLAELPAGPRPGLAVAAPRPQLPARSKRREPREQAIVLVGYPGVDLMDARFDALSVLQKALSGLSSDLGIEIREKRGLVYYVGAFSLAGLQPGFFALYAGTREEAAEEVEKLMNEQLQRIVKDGLRDEEWQRARDQLLAGHEMSLQNTAELAQGCALNELYGLGYEYSFGLPARLRALTGDAIREAAASLIDPKRQAVSLLLPDQPKPQEKSAP